jgi:hypothetical protein
VTLSFHDGEIFPIKDERHLEYWINQPVDVYLVIRRTDELSVCSPSAG